MESGLFESSGKAIVYYEGLIPRESDTPERIAVEVLENIQHLREIDEIRVNETAEIMAKVFFMFSPHRGWR